MEFVIFGILAYFLGSIPTAVWVGKARYNTDIRKHGSNNAGATNTFRVLGKKAGIVVLSIDVLKGTIAVLLPFIFLPYSWNDEYLVYIKIICGIIVVIGHIFPVFANFNGGKGVATSLGVIIGIYPTAALICMSLFLIVFIISNYVSLGAIIGAIAFPISVRFIFRNPNDSLFVFSIVLASAVIILHHKNINRLLHGKESKMNLFKK